jgi:hypothetical protein
MWKTALRRGQGYDDLATEYQQDVSTLRSISAAFDMLMLVISRLEHKVD